MSRKTVKSMSSEKLYEDEGTSFSLDSEEANDTAVSESKKIITGVKYKSIYELPEELFIVKELKAEVFFTSNPKDLTTLAEIKFSNNYTPFPKYRIIQEERKFHDITGCWVIYLEYEVLMYKFEHIESNKI